jgi:hypothetical protein
MHAPQALVTVVATPWVRGATWWLTSNPLADAPGGHPQAEVVAEGRVRGCIPQSGWLCVMAQGSSSGLGPSCSKQLFVSPDMFPGAPPGARALERADLQPPRSTGTCCCCAAASIGTCNVHIMA